MLLKHYNKANQAQFNNTFAGLDLMGNRQVTKINVESDFDENDKLASKFDAHPALSSEMIYGLNR